jgi:predicted transcriptional regulator of viral defense system
MKNNSTVQQMTHLDSVYDRMLVKEVLTLNEIKTIVEGVINRKTSKQYISQAFLKPLINKGRIERIRRGLYAIGIPSKNGILLFPTTQGTRNQGPDKFLVASKIRSKGFLSHHTAIELHGVSQTMGWRVVYVSVLRNKRFVTFDYRGVEYTSVSTQSPDIGVSEIKQRGQPIRVSSPERTFIECLERPDLCGGWEEVLKSISQLRMTDPNLFLNIAKKKCNQTLIRRLGLILQRFNTHSNYIILHEMDKVLLKLNELLYGRSIYLDRNMMNRKNERLVHDRHWRVYYPESFWDLYERGV